MKVLIVLLSLVAVAIAGRGCGDHQHYETCGTSCPLTCENHDKAPEPCDKKCNQGCFCDIGYVKTTDGKCVKPKKCNVKAENDCGKNQHFEECGTACPLTCENRNNPPEVCDLSCKRGCQCDEGFVLSRERKCVKPEKCAKPKCGDHKHYEACGTSCPLTCENYDDPPEVCDDKCNEGCFCNMGYIRNKDGKCVKPRKCPGKGKNACGDHQHYESCGTSCPLTCENHDKAPEPCDKKCNQGCFCDIGYVKTKDGKCVKPRNCPVKAEDVMQNTCLADPDSGVCDAYFLMWYYDIRTESCKQFVYGGCGGNGNKYQTEEECMDNCKDVKTEKHDLAICSLPVKEGLCEAYMPRFYFDQETGECKSFIYGGCGGNKNNFMSIEECKRVCG